MSCPHCLSASTSKRKHRASLGYRTFFCRDCGRRFNERTGSPFNNLQFPTDLVLLAVLWRLRYKLSFRDVAELLLQRGFEISHETIRVWEFRFAPLVSENLRSKRRGTAGVSWYPDDVHQGRRSLALAVPCDRPRWKPSRFDAERAQGQARSTSFLAASAGRRRREATADDD